MKPLAVSALNHQIKALLESHFLQVSVVGEVGRVTAHSSGHIYFTLKDDSASVDAVLFRGNASKLKFRLETGMQIVAHGSISVYVPRGNYQLLCTTLEPAGAGSLAVAFEQLKRELSAKGYFDPAHKKPLPRYPKTLALVTSATGAALQDMLQVAARRWPLTRLIGVNVLVQGDGAPASIVSGLRYADGLGADAVVLARGGGSMEDLWGFNDAGVAEAVFAMQTPVLSAVGHEIDTVITDFVADGRAPTPSAAMEMLLPEINEERLRLADLADGCDRRLSQILVQKRGALEQLQESFAHHTLGARIDRHQEQIATLSSALDQHLCFVLSHHQNRLQNQQEELAIVMRNTFAQKAALLRDLQERIALFAPANRLPVKSAQLLSEGKVVTVGALKPETEVTLLDATHRASARIIKMAPL